MKEAAKGQIVILKSPKIGEAEAIIDKAEPDRIKLLWSKVYDVQISKLEEGDEVLVAVHTSAGIKKMKSMVLNSGRELHIESAPAVSDPQNRSFVRANAKIRVFVKKDGELIGATTQDISGGGLRIIPDKNEVFTPGEVFEVKFQEDDFSKDFSALAQVVKVFEGNIYALNFTEINEHDQDKIVRFCIRALT